MTYCMCDNASLEAECKTFGTQKTVKFKKIGKIYVKKGIICEKVT